MILVYLDKPILSAASLAGASFIITENIKDFGARDLSRLQMSAAHPDLFLANQLSIDTYRNVLGRLAKARTRQPCTAEEIHRVETGDLLPLLAQRMRAAYPVEPSTAAGRRTPRLTFRGVRCVACGKLFTNPGSLALGVCAECHIE
ncbi:MAG: hypothetical protein QM582_14825 [Micropruina sp.]|uniref:hypothetical protein n=1 Tax=Micropruina sp. TaxID=2737536 RepID=UPI0039E3DD84